MKTPVSARDGFAHQHLRIVPEPVRRAAQRHPLLRSLLVTDAGYFPTAAGHCIDRPGGVATHLVIACLRGTGWVRGGEGGEQPVRAGDLVWLDAGEAHAYGAGVADPWTIAWVHFTGTEAAAWRGQLARSGRTNPVILRLPPDRVGEVPLAEVCAWLERGYAVPHLLGAAAVLRLGFCAALHLGAAAGAARPAAERVGLVAARICAQLDRSHTLAELAAAAGLSIPHFSQLFRRQTGYAPVDYLIRQRIARACQLLDTTTAPIGQIAARVGYEDAYYFTRCFRRVMGRSPREYRRIVKG